MVNTQHHCLRSIDHCRCTNFLRSNINDIYIKIEEKKVSCFLFSIPLYSSLVVHFFPVLSSYFATIQITSLTNLFYAEKLGVRHD